MSEHVNKPVFLEHAVQHPFLLGPSVCACSYGLGEQPLFSVACSSRLVYPLLPLGLSPWKAAVLHYRPWSIDVESHLGLGLAQFWRKKKLTWFRLCFPVWLSKDGSNETNCVLWQEFQWLHILFPMLVRTYSSVLLPATRQQYLCLINWHQQV